MSAPHFKKLAGALRTATAHPTGGNEKVGNMYFDTDDNALYIYNGTNWLGMVLTTTTSTSTTTTTTSTSTTTTTTSTSTT